MCIASKHRAAALRVRGRAGRSPSARRGFVLLAVLCAIGASIVLAMAFIQTQTSALQMRQNTQRRNRALEAAQAGASAALARMHETGWSVTETVSRTVIADAEGTSSYSVTFLTAPNTLSNPFPTDGMLRVVVRSVGTWQSSSQSSEKLQAVVEATARLKPRLTGRTIGPGDSSVASDSVTNPSGYDQIQTYAMFAKNGTPSLIIDPRDRVDGNLWLKDGMTTFADPSWSSTIRREYLRSIGRSYATSGTRYPHPVNGTLYFNVTPSSAVQTDLSDMGAVWQQTSTNPTYPDVTFSNWLTYKLYNGGFTYNAALLSATLSNVALGPTADNPLGIFYRNGSVTLYDNVTITGTLIATSKVTIDGDNVNISSFNWRDSTGAYIADSASLWPRLPAIVALQMETMREIQTSIDGAVIAHTSFLGGGSDYEQVSATSVDITGTATSSIAQQPYSTVQIQGSVNLSGVTADGKYSVWLDKGPTGSWHTIVGVNSAAAKLTVVGEVVNTSPTTFRIRRTRKNFADIRGPMMAKTIDLNRPDAWVLTSTGWNDVYTRFNNMNNWLQMLGQPKIEFVDWVASPSVYSGYGWPYTTYALSLEATFQVSYQGGAKFQFAPPLFSAYAGTGSNAPYAGYRWEVISWREVL